MTKRRSPESLFRALLSYEDDDPNLKPIEKMTKEEVDEELRSQGLDPVAVGERGAKLANALLDELDARIAAEAKAAEVAAAKAKKKLN
jgi:hypothetical protein